MVSISPLGYEVNESAGVVEVAVETSGRFPSAISGTVTTISGTAGEQLPTIERRHSDIALSFFRLQ